MDNYFIKAFLKDNFLGITGVASVAEHFMRPDQNFNELIYVISKACKSLEEWTIEVRLGDIKAPFKYGLNEKDIEHLGQDKQIELLQYYSNAYVFLYHICKSTENRLDKTYTEHLDLNLLQEEGGEDLNEYTKEVQRRIMDKWNRELL